MSLVMSFDFGLSYIGVAVGQSITKTASGIATLKCRGEGNHRTPNGRPRWHQIEALLQTHAPEKLVVGLPLNMDGSDSEMAERAKTFADQLAQKSQLSVALHDERLTSHEAKLGLERAREAGQASTDHELAACLILESWFR